MKPNNTPAPEFSMLFSVERADVSTAKARFLAKARRNNYTERWHRELEALPGDGTLEQLKEIGIPEGWYMERCSCCLVYSHAVVSFDVGGGEYDYCLCENCLSGALIAIQRPES